MIGLDLANSEFRGALINLRGKLRNRVGVPVVDRDGDAALELVYQLVERLLAMAKRPVLGIGIGTPGLVDADNGVVRNAVNLDWKDLPLKELLERRFGLPCHVSNDSQVAALAELTFGAGKEARNLVVIKLGRGVGAGIAISRELYYGDGFGAGEIGHIVVVDNGDLCNCGRRGCLETVISSRALIKQAQRIAASRSDSILNQLAASPDQISATTLIKACEAGDADVQQIAQEAASILGSTIATMAGALNIQHFILAGSLAGLGACLTEPAQQQVNSRILPALAGDTRIEISTLGPDIVLLGCAALILSHELGIA
jgi:glucokinase-like ROK family protein